MTAPCCSLARHPSAALIDAALLPPDSADPRQVAARFMVSKTLVYEHRRHLLAAKEPSPTASSGPTVVSVRSVDVPRDSVAVPRNEGESVHFEQKNTVETHARAQPQVVDSMSVPRSAENRGIGQGYAGAVAACAEAITRGVMRPAVLQGIAAKFGISQRLARQAHQEGARHLRMDMGGVLERQESSIAWGIRQRDDALQRAQAREKQAEEWRRKERESNEAAQKIVDPEARIAALDSAARMGLVASKYGLEAEKWAALALSHQKQLDDVQCLVRPKEINFNQFNQVNVIGADAMAAFVGELAKRFANRPEILAELDAAAAEVERTERDVIETTGVAA